MKKKGFGDKTGLMRALRTEKFETKSPIPTTLQLLTPTPTTLQSPPPPSEIFDDKTKRNKRMLTGRGLNISPIKKSDESILENEFNEKINEMEDELDNITKEGKTMDNIRKIRNEKIHKFQDMAEKSHKNDKQSKLIQGAEETKQRREKIKEITKNNASNKINKFMFNIAEQKKANKGKSRSEPINESVTDFLEDSDSEYEPETKPEGKKKKQSKEDKEEGLNHIFSQLAPNMLDDGIQSIDKEIEEYEKENKRHIILKESSDDLNKKLSRYGLKFRTGTMVSSVLKKLKDHKDKLETRKQVGEIKGKLVDLGSEGKRDTKDNKKLEAK